jgi:hypothetical protein
MQRTVLLHIGAPKSGSTFLQRALIAGQDRLRARGIDYPHPGTGHPGNAGGLGAFTAEAFDALFGDGVHTVILSHEDLFATEREAMPLAHWARDAGVAVRRLCFLRPWSEFCVGDFSQTLKQNLETFLERRRAFDGLTFEQLATRRAQKVDAAAIFLRWARVMPLPPLTLAPHHAIAETVEGLLGGPGLDWQVPRHLANPSLRLTDAEALAAMIDDPAVPPEDVRAAYHAALARAGEPDPARSADRMARIEAMFAPQNRALMALYGFDNSPRPV